MGDGWRRAPVRAVERPPGSRRENHPRDHRPGGDGATRWCACGQWTASWAKRRPVQSKAERRARRRPQLPEREGPWRKRGAATCARAKGSAKTPLVTLADNQLFRLMSLASARPESVRDREAIVAALRDAGAEMTLNNLWTLSSLSASDKLAMTRRVMRQASASILRQSATRFFIAAFRQ